jgi:hypothetical protein
MAKLLALPVKIRLGRHEPIVANTLAYLIPKLIQGPHAVGKLLALPAKIRLGRTEPRVANTLAY